MKNISYSHSWEDYSLLVEALKIEKTDKILGIASAGESIFTMANQSPKKIIAVDNNLSQIYLVKLKIVVIKYLNYNEMLEFFGFEKSKNRINLYNNIKKYLNNDELNFWDKNFKLIDDGIIHSGKLEKYFNLFRKYLLPIIINNKNLTKYLNSKNLKEQGYIYNKYWNNYRWKFLHSIFFSKLLLKSLGRDKKYFSNLELKDISNYYFKKASKSFKNIPIKKSYFAQYLIFGKIKDYELLTNHPYLNKKNYNLLKLNLENIELVHNDIDKYLESTKFKFNKIHLSDIFENFTQKKYENLLEIICLKSKKKITICYWNNLIDRSHHKNISNLKIDKKLSKKLFKKDKTNLFYSKFIIEKN